MTRTKPAATIFAMLMTACLAQSGNLAHAAPPAPQATRAARTPVAMPAQSRGEMLYSVSCESCHASEVHWREKKLATDPDSLRREVQRWKVNVGAAWSEDDVGEVTRYLNAVFYRFPAADSPKESAAPEDRLKPRRQGEISYISGGLLPEERQALRAVARDYNLRIGFAHKPAAREFAGVRIVLSNAAQEKVLDAIASGPLFLADLPTGRYRLTIEKGNQRFTKTVSLAKGRTVSLHF